MTIAGVVVMLCRQVETQGSSARPWLCGVWHGEGFELWLCPDGYFCMDNGLNGVDGNGWKTEAVNDEQTEFVLTCGFHRFAVPRVPDSSVQTIDLIGKDILAPERFERPIVSRDMYSAVSRMVIGLRLTGRRITLPAG